MFSIPDASAVLEVLRRVKDPELYQSLVEI